MALHWAAMRGHVEIVRALCAHPSADRTARNGQGRTPADLCQAQWSHAWRYTKAALEAA